MQSTMPFTQQVPRFNSDEVNVDAILGSGAYSTVYKVRLAGPESSGALSTSSSDSCDTRLADPESSPEFYALKRLHGKNDEETQESAALDLLGEASLLAKLPHHENIVRLHGVSSGFWFQPSSGFLLLDYLPESLESRLAMWKDTRHRDPQQRVMEVCLPVARALAFLHNNNICYRDLKPENIGFDVDGNIRLYDFGFARKAKQGKLTLKKRVGTPRYMAPEVMKKERYGTPSDIYSFSVMVWEVLMLKKPYEKATDFDHLIEMVAEEHVRPSVSWTFRWKEIKDLMSWCWHKDQEQRPIADQVVTDLTKACKSALKKQAKSQQTVIEPKRLSLAPSAA